LQWLDRINRQGREVFYVQLSIHQPNGTLNQNRRLARKSRQQNDGRLNDEGGGGVD